MRIYYKNGGLQAEIGNGKKKPSEKLIFPEGFKVF